MHNEHTGDEDIRKRDVPRECRKKKAPSGGLGEMIVGSTVCVSILLFLVSHYEKGGWSSAEGGQRKFIYNIKMIYFGCPPSGGKNENALFIFIL